MRHHTVVILGKHEAGFSLHEATREALHHAAAHAGCILNTRWMSPDDMILYPGLVTESHAVVLAPPGPRTPRVLPGSVLDALTLVRDRDVPILAMGAAHGLVFIEVARNVLGMQEANSTYFDPDTADPVVHALELPPRDPEARLQDHVRTVSLELADDPLVGPLHGGPGVRTEKTDITHGLNPDYAQGIEEAGLRPAMVATEDRRPYLHVMEGLRFHVTAAFLPQLASTRSEPHPLFRGLVTAATEGPSRS